MVPHLIEYLGSSGSPLAINFSPTDNGMGLALPLAW